MATTSLGTHYYIKDGHRDTVLSKLKGVIDLCAKEPEFINAIISKSPERVPASRTLPPMTCAAVPVHGYVIWRVVSLSRFSFCSGTPRLTRLSAISGASRNSTGR
jgi:hypothetical protein